MTDAEVTPLGDCRVIDVSTFLAGPFCSTQLAEFGAEVIKLELPRVGDALRKFGTITECGDSLPWLSECRNKKTATLDLRKPEGAGLLKRLVAMSDVLVENFQPGTMEKWGIGWAPARKPRSSGRAAGNCRCVAAPAHRGSARCRRRETARCRI